MNKPPIIALSGYATAGKDAACEHIVNRVPGALRYAFADAVKREVCRSRRISLLDLEGSKEFYRADLQECGQNRRAEHPDYWVDKVCSRWSQEAPRLAVLTDTRYPNEAAWARSIGGVLVRVVRPGIGPVNGHESEVALDGLEPNFILRNDGDLAKFHARIDCLLIELGWYQL